jgi:hypothetical protein
VGSLGAFMPFGNANDQTETLPRKKILPRITDVPILNTLKLKEEK